jgi:hypothetical protein
MGLAQLTDLVAGVCDALYTPTRSVYMRPQPARPAKTVAEPAGWKVGHTLRFDPAHVLPIGKKK